VYWLQQTGAIAVKRVEIKMKPQRVLLWTLPLLLFIGLVLLLWRGLYRDPRSIPSPFINKPSPEFHAESLLDPSATLSQQNFKGQVTLLNVFATWCVACQAEHSVWMEARQDLNHAQIIGLNYKDQRDKALSWLKDYGNPYQQIISDPYGNIAIDFGVYGTPETILIDKQGIIRYKFIGAVSLNDWKQVLAPQVKKWEAVANEND
jgi:cytochrome c biogenesis protein CcmG/thiol:disulfide interchange protein DsbE